MSPALASSLEAVLTTITYAAAVVSVLRASSRATYMLSHDGRMGIVDGPLILGPADVRRRREEIRSEAAQRMADAEGLTVEELEQYDLEVLVGPDEVADLPQVSPLWESSYGFQQAVRLAMHITEGQQPSRDKRHGNHINCDEEEGEPKRPPEWRAIEYAPIDMELEISKRGGKRKGLLARALSGKDGAPYSLSPRPLVQKRSKADEERLKLTFDWHRGTASWVASADAYVQRGKQVLKGDDGLDFNLMASSKIAIPGDEDHSKAGRVAHLSVYAPAAFARLRRMFGITESDYLNSMAKKYVSFQSNSKGAARAGLFFFFTRDGAYMIKTIKRDEAKTFSNILPKYYKFMKRNAKRSLLTRFCGMYSVKVTDASQADGRDSKAKEHVFIVMNSVFPAEASKFISERFDLKGSTVGRECSTKEREEKGPNAVLKDLDLAREVSAAAEEQAMLDEPNYGINIGRRTKASLLAQLRRDVALLEECQVMDYSLLVGVVRNRYDPDSILNKQQRPKDMMMPFGLLNLREDSLVERIVSSPVGKKIHGVVDKALWWVLPSSLPYYGAGLCGVDGGSFSIVPGRRSGHRAVYYLGIIDFLQPWTWKKVMENEMKGLLGYNTKAISCVSPKDYAARFLDFIDAHIT